MRLLSLLFLAVTVCAQDKPEAARERDRGLRELGAVLEYEGHRSGPVAAELWRIWRIP